VHYPWALQVELVSIINGIFLSGDPPSHRIINFLGGKGGDSEKLSPQKIQGPPLQPSPCEFCCPRVTVILNTPPFIELRHFPGMDFVLSILVCQELSKVPDWCLWGGGCFKIIYLKGGCSSSLRGGDGAGSTQKVSLFPGVNYLLLVVMVFPYQISKAEWVQTKFYVLYNFSTF
jgi:hypothetical protein